MPTKSKLLNIRIDGELKRAAKRIAVEDGRSLSNWVTHLIEIEVRKATKEYDHATNSNSRLGSA